MRVGLLFSGGKDSTLASFILSQQGFEVLLITFIPENKDSFMLHTKALEIVDLQSKCLGLDIKKFHIKGEKEEEIEEMLSKISDLSIDALASGAILSEYQKQRIDYIANSLSIPSFSPLWHKFLYSDYEKMEIIFSSVSALGLTKNELGKSAIPFLRRYNAFEGGDAETLVLDAPFFSHKIAIEFDTVWKGMSGEIAIKSCCLIDKTSFQTKQRFKNI